jgi:hypothetical protein
VFDEVSKSELVIILYDRANLDCEAKLAPLFGLLVLADIVDESVVELSDFDGWIGRELVIRFELPLGQSRRTKETDDQTYGYKQQTTSEKCVHGVLLWKGWCGGAG